MRMIMVNGLLLCLIFMWTSAAIGPAAGPVMDENANRKDIQLRRKACSNIGGRCVRRKKDCPDNKPVETKRGKPYCSKKRRCCYPEQSRCGIQKRINQCVQFDGNPGVLQCGRHPIDGAIPAYKWCYINRLGVRGDCGRVPCNVQQEWNWKPCDNHNGVDAECGHHPIDFNGQQIIPNFAWCYTGEDDNLWGYCTNPCATVPNKFTRDHVCQDCDSNAETKTWVIGNRPRIPNSHKTTVFSDIQDNIAYKWSTFNNPQYSENTCKIDIPVKTWLCKARYGSEGLVWHECEDKGLCTGIIAVVNGHFFKDSRNCN